MSGGAVTSAPGSTGGSVETGTAVGVADVCARVVAGKHAPRISANVRMMERTSTGVVLHSMEVIGLTYLRQTADCGSARRLYSVVPDV